MQLLRREIVFYAQVLNISKLERDLSAIEKAQLARFQLPLGQQIKTVNSKMFFYHLN